ncbi:hypothetical protein PCC7424_5503 (plasmid) [Gloeothece citriformis PCC 7424]|uniref:Uncharacterized protein n=1 Tax=Gloeothece citriformis (strain PCC 7424) TaxID=65393 RepID=B7KMQ0_GLOC7|nr:hypothetical protein [Gloeothece citriformis]ACK74072.1 hypothetical protein PCC7424_5503 [Gloeothece citriformis PCC 7424]
MEFPSCSTSIQPLNAVSKSSSLISAEEIEKEKEEDINSDFSQEEKDWYERWDYGHLAYSEY